MQAIRGAITVDEDSAEAIERATHELIEELTRCNDLTAERVISALFSMTPDLQAGFPGAFARGHGWADVPIIHAQEVHVRGALARCLRVLLHVEPATPSRPVTHVYLKGARMLRPDLASQTSEAWTA